MDIGIREQGGITIVAVSGQIDATTAPSAQAKILAAVKPKGRMILDLANVSYTSSAGLRILLVTYRTLHGKGGQVILAGLPDTLKDTLKNVGFLDFFPHQNTVEDALAAMSTGNGETHGS